MCDEKATVLLSRVIVDGFLARKVKVSWDMEAEEIE